MSELTHPNLASYHRIKKYCVNLDHRTDRYQSIREQVGDDFIRWSACNGNAYQWQDLPEVFDIAKTFKFYRCNPSRQSASCTISHYRIYQDVANDDALAPDDFVLITEDDNRYIPQFKEKLSQIIDFLSQERFKDLEICILRLSGLEEQVDFAYELSQLTKDQTHLAAPGVIDSLVAKGFSRKKLEILSKYDYYFHLHIPKLQDNSPAGRAQHPFVFGFDYQGLEPSTDPELYTERQNFFFVNFMKPFSSACYLIRKSTCQKIIARHAKPYWFTDDFKQLVSINKIIYASPFLALESEVSKNSDICSTQGDSGASETMQTQYVYNQVNSLRYKYQFGVFTKLPFLLHYRISGNKFKRMLAIALQKLFLIDY